MGLKAGVLAMSDMNPENQTGVEVSGDTTPEYTRREALDSIKKYSLGVSVAALTASAAVTQAAASSPGMGGDDDDNDTGGF